MGTPYGLHRGNDSAIPQIPTRNTILHAIQSPSGNRSISDRFIQVRAQSEALCARLEPEDLVVQSMPDASPAKWHLAHTTWFFERMVLKEFLPHYDSFHPRYDYLFNSYYLTVGMMHPRPTRGLLSRPTVREVLAYRRRIDEQVLQLLIAPQAAASTIETLVTLGLAHEEQHQELLLTDLKHAFSCNPLEPRYTSESDRPAPAALPHVERVHVDGGLYEIGHDGIGFAFDNEGPRHSIHLNPFAIATRPVSCGEYLAFIADGGYRRPELWLSDGWAILERSSDKLPLYWRHDADNYDVFTLHGRRAVVAAEPVCHLSYYEADAFARWAGARLPTEAEWEVAATIAAPRETPQGAHPDVLQPTGDMQQVLGGVWEWTQSAYGPYPGFRPLPGALGEYNGKFMCSQVVLRGGSCATPRGHIRLTYRNFFPPSARWQFSGLRLAYDR